MAMTDLKEIQKGKFAEAIKICDNQIKTFKNSPDKQKKYQEAKKALQEAQAKLNDIIEKTKTILLNEPDPADATKKLSFYDKFIGKKNENFVTLAWLSSKIAIEKTAGNFETASVAVVDELKFGAKEIDPRFDMIDRTKSITKQFLEGKGVSAWLAKGCLAVGIGEILTKGITSYLAKEGIMQSAMGLFGLGKLGIAHLPTLWASLSAGMTTLVGFAPLAVGAAAAFAVVKGIPMVNNLINKVKKKHKDAYAFDKGIEKILKEQEATALQI